MKKFLGVLMVVIFLFTVSSQAGAGDLIQCALVQVNEATTPEGYVYYFAAHFVVPEGYSFPKTKDEFPSSPYNFIMQEKMQEKLREIRKEKNPASIQIVDVRFHYLNKAVPQTAAAPAKTK